MSAEKEATYSVFVGNVSYDSTEEEVKKLFDGFKIKEFKFLTKKNGKCEGKCFVIFETEEEAERAIQ